MAKKIALLMVALLLCSTVVFVSCSQNAGGGGITPPTPKEKVVNDGEGDHSQNLVYGGDFGFGDDHDIKDDGSDISIAAGEGIDGSDALFVFQNSGEGYGEVLFDATKYYGRGKSYYVEASFRNAGLEGTPDTDLKAKISFTVVSGAAYNKFKKTYDIDGQYDYSWLSESDALEIFETTTKGGSAGLDIDSTSWTKVSAILDAETIDAMITSQTETYGPGEEPTLHTMEFTFFVGTWPNQDGYKYYLDNVKVIDLNDELDRTGRTWKDPTAVEPDEDEEEE